MKIWKYNCQLVFKWPISTIMKTFSFFVSFLFLTWYPLLLLIFFLSWFILILEKVRIPLVIGTHPPLCTTLTGTTFSASLNNHTTGVSHIQGGEWKVPVFKPAQISQIKSLNFSWIKNRRYKLNTIHVINANIWIYIKRIK